MVYKDPVKQREYQRKWILNRRQEYLKDKGCEFCGSNEGLEINHKDPTKKWSHRIWSYRAEIREKELTKCNILCKKCHQKETNKYFVPQNGYRYVNPEKNEFQCTECLNLKPKDEFRKDKTRRFNLKSHCKLCSRKNDRIYNLTKRNRE